jgi:hypothetical protein
MRADNLFTDGSSPSTDLATSVGFLKNPAAADSTSSFDGNTPPRS